MRNVVADKARELDVDPGLLASRRQLETLIREYDADGTVPERFSGWRQAVITDDLITVLNDQ